MAERRESFAARRERNLRNQMMDACTGYLTEREILAVDARVVHRIVDICAAVVERDRRRKRQVSGPPPRNFIAARFLRPGDMVWTADYAFIDVESVGRDQSDVVVLLGDGTEIRARESTPIPTALNPSMADEWNRERVLFDRDQLEALRNLF